MVFKANQKLQQVVDKTSIEWRSSRLYWKKLLILFVGTDAPFNNFDEALALRGDFLINYMKEKFLHIPKLSFELRDYEWDFSNCVGATLEGLNSDRNHKLSICLGANIALQSLQIDSALFRAIGLECLDIAGRQESSGGILHCSVNNISPINIGSGSMGQ